MSSIIDNSKDKPLLKEVNQLLDQSEFSRMAVGFFYLSGFEAIREKLNKIKSLRLIIGNRTNQQTLEELIKGHTHRDIISTELRKQSVKTREQKQNIKKETLSAYANDLAFMEQNEENETGLKALSELIQENRIEVRVYTKGVLHSKAYIFEDPENNFAKEGIAIVGSSNLSISGLKNNAELNVKLTHPNDIIDVKEWFDKIWDESESFSDELFNVLKNSWCQHQVSPFDIYIKTLYHLVEDRINIKENAELVQLGFDLNILYPFQRDAFNQAINRLENPNHIQNGIFIADVVGLGKSYIAIALISYYWSIKRKSTLIICPASLKEMWEEYREVYQLHCRIISSGELFYTDENPDFTLNDDPAFDGYDVVVIDESHNFRNPETQKYKILAPYLQDKKTILLTATPQNKSVWDVYHQIKLFHQSDITNLNIAPNNLKRYFKNYEESPEKIAEFLQNFVIRRTRNDILNSPKYQTNDLQFPKRKLITIDYEIDSTYSTNNKESIYETIIDLLFKREKENRYQYSIYDLTSFLKKNKQKLKTYQGLSYFGDLCRGLLKTLLFKRLESSVVAFNESINRMIKRHEIILKFIQERNVVVTGRIDQIELFLDFSSGSDFELKNMNEYPADDFKVQELVFAIKEDIKVLKKVTRLVKPLIDLPEKDLKFQKFRDEVLIPNRKEKIIIFSEFSETISYLYERIKSEFPNIQSASITSKVKSSTKSNIVRRFSPKSQTSYGLNEGEKEIQFLFSTDILSEGQNLQDAHIVVNYDFHWNPVRLIQRIGRIDRIGSTADEIKIYNFLPDINIERHLDLKARVHNRIEQIHRIFGLDSQILSEEEELNEKSLFAIYSDQDDSVLDTDDNITTIFDNAEQTLLELERNNKAEYDRIINLEDGIRTSCKSDPNGTFAFFTSGNLSRLYFYNGEMIIDNLPEILNVIEAKPDFPKPIKLDETKHRENYHIIYEHFKRELKLRQQEISSNQITPEQRHFIERLQGLYNLFNQTDFELTQKINRLSTILGREIPDYAATKLRKMRRDNISDGLLIDALENLIKIANIEDFQSRLVQSEKMMIRTICSETLI